MKKYNMFDMQKLVDFIGKSSDNKTFLHNTSEGTKSDELQDINILINDGFQFEDQLRHTSDEVTSTDSATMNWWDVQRSIYGPYTVVIQISKSLYDKYSNGRMMPEQALSLDRSYDDENDEWVYTLQPQFLKGYFNRTDNNTVYNPKFDPNYDNAELASLNIKRFLEE